MIKKVTFYNYQTGDWKNEIVEPELPAPNLFNILRRDDSSAFRFTATQTMELWKVEQDAAVGQTTWIVILEVTRAGRPPVWFSFEKLYDRAGSNTPISSAVVIQISEHEEDVRDRLLGMKRTSCKGFNFMSEERAEKKKSVEAYLDIILDKVLPRHGYRSVVTDKGAYEFANSLFDLCY